jgi:hypothetical protein
LHDCVHVRLSHRIAPGEPREHADLTHPVGLLRAERQRPDRWRHSAAEKYYEFSPPHGFLGTETFKRVEAITF